MSSVVIDLLFGQVVPYNLLRESRVSITITNVLGETIETVLDGIQSMGYHKIQWKTKNISVIQYNYVNNLYRIQRN